MFGKNQLIGTDFTSDGLKLAVQEIFPTIQGEGPFIGRPAIFIRLGFCNLKCWFCDTDFESRVINLTIDEILEQVSEASMKAEGRLVVITGGEPMRQNIAPLIDLLINHFYKVQIETAGTVWPPKLLDTWRARLHCESFDIVCSPKTGKVNSHIQQATKYWKYVISASQKIDVDGLPIALTQHGTNNAVILAKPPAWIDKKNVYLSPMDEYDQHKNKANYELVAKLCMKHGYTANIQMHKVMGLP
jgi:7-carboxy-7-deazaguanine synthase